MLNDEDFTRVGGQPDSPRRLTAAENRMTPGLEDMRAGRIVSLDDIDAKLGRKR